MGQASKRGAAAHRHNAVSPAGVCGGGGPEARGGGAEEEPVSHVRTVGLIAVVGSRAFDEGELGAAAMVFLGGRRGRSGTDREAEETTDGDVAEESRTRRWGYLIFYFIFVTEKQLINI